MWTWMEGSVDEDSKEVFPFDGLPDELFEHILSFIPLRGLEHLSLVSKYFYNKKNSYDLSWQRIVKAHYPNHLSPPLGLCKKAVSALFNQHYPKLPEELRLYDDVFYAYSYEGQRQELRRIFIELLEGHLPFEFLYEPLQKKGVFFLLTMIHDQAALNSIYNKCLEFNRPSFWTEAYRTYSQTREVQRLWGLTNSIVDVLDSVVDNSSEAKKLSNLQWAVICNQPTELIDELISSHKSDPFGMTPLHLAVAFGREALVSHLLGQHKYRVDVTNDDGLTPVDYCLNNEKIWERLSLARGLFFHALAETYRLQRDNLGWRYDAPLSFAALRNQTEFCSFLLKNKYPHWSDAVVENAFHWACVHGNLALYKELDNRYPKMKYATLDQGHYQDEPWTLLDIALMNRQAELAIYLLEQGVETKKNFHHPIVYFSHFDSDRRFEVNMAYLKAYIKRLQLADPKKEIERRHTWSKPFGFSVTVEMELKAALVLEKEAPYYPFKPKADSEQSFQFFKKQKYCSEEAEGIYDRFKEHPRIQVAEMEGLKK